MSTKLRWNSHAILGHAKCLIGLAVCEDVMINGKGSGFYSRSRKPSRLRQIVGDTLPDAIDQLGVSGEINRSNGKNGERATFDNQSLLLNSRAIACLPKELGGGGEFNHFYRPEFLATLTLICDSLKTSRTIRADDIYHIQEQRLLAERGQGPGVYVREDPHNPSQGYIGQSINIAKRSHSNAHHRVVEIYATQTATAAKDLEAEIFSQIKERGKCCPATPTGLVRFIDDRSVSEVVADIMRSGSAKRLFRNTIRLEGHKPRIRLPALVVKIGNWHHQLKQEKAQ